MRKIEFRAKSKFDKNKKWVYGDLIQGENAYISTKEEFYSAVVSLGGHLSTFVELVDKATIGQYTGRKDKNGTKIFEGDIVKGNFPYAKLGFIVWDEKRCGMYVKPISHFGRAAYDKYYKLNACKLEIVGNIYDNTELLEGKDE